MPGVKASVELKINLQEDLEEPAVINKVRKGGDALIGELGIHADSLDNYQIILAFEGFQRTRLGISDGFVASHLRPTAKHQFLRQIEELNSNLVPHCHAIGQCPYRLPFNFIIPQRLISPQSEVSSEFLNLLPSMEEGSIASKTNAGCIGGQVFVQYLLTASLTHSRSGKTYRSTREILIMPATPIAPPLQINDFPNEYVPMCQGKLRKHLWKRPIGKVTLSALEPSALNISTRAPKATTAVSVKLLFEPSKAGMSVAPYEWTATVKHHLRITTFVTTETLKHTPNYDCVKKNPLVRRFSTNTAPEIGECETLPWRLDRVSSQGTILPDSLVTPWTTTLLVPVSAPRTLIPTFLSPLSARRYTVILQINVSNLSRRSLSLEIPVQIVNDQPHVLGKPQESMSTQRPGGLTRGDIKLIASLGLEDGTTVSSSTKDMPPPYETNRNMLCR